MSNTILPTLASVNATVVGILFAVLLAFFIYSYQVLIQTKEKLSDLRLKIAKEMNIGGHHKEGNTNYSKYLLDDGTLNFRKHSRGH